MYAIRSYYEFPQLKTYIEKYLRDKGYTVEGLSFQNLTDKLYCEMAEYSLLTKYLGRDEIEEININGWDDIAVTYVDGRIRITSYNVCYTKLLRLNGQKQKLIGMTQL